MKNSGNITLLMEKDKKKDEYYTQFVDTERKLKYYKHHFNDNVVYCNDIRGNHKLSIQFRQKTTLYLLNITYFFQM